MRIEHAHKLLLLVLIGCVIAALSAGCVTTEEQITYTEVPLDSQTEKALAEIAGGLRAMDISSLLDLYYLSDQIGRTGTEQGVHDIINDYYAKNTYLNGIVYYDNATGGSIESPIYSPGKISDVISVPTEEDFISAGGAIGLGPVYIPDLGMVALLYAPVFTPEGEYKGCLLFISEVYLLLQEGERLAGNDVAYGNYTILLATHDEIVDYATQQEYIGTKLEKGVPNKIRDSIIIFQENVTGAYQYAGDNTSITTAWERVFVHKNEYTIFLTKKDNAPAVSYEDQFTPVPDEMRDDVTAAWRYALTSGQDNAMERINGGFYSYEVYAVSTNGTMIAAPPDKKETIGLNYINGRGQYGIPYMRQMITTAQQGGGYVTYFDPSDNTQIAEAGLFTIAYVMPVNDDWFILGISPGSTNYTKTNKNLRGDIVAVARGMVGYAHDKGVESTIQTIVDNPGGNGTLFAKDISTDVNNLVIFDYNGTVHANIQVPEMNGDNAMYYTDVFGASVVRKSVITAKSGGGITYDYQWNEDMPGYADLWLYSIEPIDDTYFALAGAKVITTENYVKTGLRN
ncbi:cache domain-containing protein [Methanorbis rubei]|uniref:Uncharacterized protein n=1 Tax=Methanorbis rubei TaxID=3028300 RepID=A0AAE4SBW2_9EURY|nr:hypothetical protein [Methanocorpusculaceae archaeon Cs1]